MSTRRAVHGRPRRRAPSSSSRTTSGSSARSSTSSSRPAARSRSCPRPRPRPTCSRASPTACSSRTVPAIRPRSRTRARTSRALLGKVPVFGICLGHQIMGLALGATHVQAAVRSPRRQPSRCSTSRRAASRSRARTTTTRSTPRRCRTAATVTHLNLNDGDVEGVRCAPTCSAFSVQYHPEAGPGPHDARYLFDGVHRSDEGEHGLSDSAPPRRPRDDPADRQRPDRHRSGVRVRLLGHAGVPRAARRGLPRRARELEPGDDHDRPRVRRRDLRRAARRPDARAHHREGTPRRAAADARRPDRAQPRGRAARGGRARRVRRRDDRRQRRGDPHRRGPPAVQDRDDGDRAAGPAVGHRVHRRRSATRRGRGRLPGDRPARVHPRRRRHRHRARPRRRCSRSRRAASPRARSPRS